MRLHFESLTNKILRVVEDELRTSPLQEWNLATSRAISDNLTGTRTIQELIASTRKTVHRAVVQLQKHADATADGFLLRKWLTVCCGQRSMHLAIWTSTSTSSLSLGFWISN